MSERYVFDTDVASYIIKGRSHELVRRFNALPMGDVFISVITRAELLYGLRRRPVDHPLHERVGRFLNFSVMTLPRDNRAAHFYADIRHQLTTQGRPIGERDMMSAAHALALEATLISNNVRHYERIEGGLSLVQWRDE